MAPHETDARTPGMRARRKGDDGLGPRRPANGRRGSGGLRAVLVMVAVASAIVCLRAAAPARGDGVSFPDVVDHFKYGSIGAEENSGLSYWIWRVLPHVCEEHLPKRPGTGEARLGCIDEGAAHGRPVGTSFRPGRGDRVGLNCATCHVGTLRAAPDGPRQAIAGMPANQMDLQGYARFLTACAKSPAFETGAMISGGSTRSSTSSRGSPGTARVPDDVVETGRQRRRALVGPASALGPGARTRGPIRSPDA